MACLYSTVSLGSEIVDTLLGNFGPFPFKQMDYHPPVTLGQKESKMNVGQAFFLLPISSSGWCMWCGQWTH